MATAVIDRIEGGCPPGTNLGIVIFETVYTLERTYKQSREQIAFALLPIIDLPGIILPGKRYYRRIFVHYCARPLGFADAYHVVLMQRLRLDQILSFDTDFDHVPGISRRER